MFIHSIRCRMYTAGLVWAQATLPPLNSYAPPPSLLARPC